MHTDRLLLVALDRPLTVQDVGRESSFPEPLQAICNAVARKLAERYLADYVPWPLANAAIENLLPLMTLYEGDATPELAWDVYLAFHKEESSGGVDDAVTRPLIRALLATQ